ncbi:MAG TPA: hypothetical protein DCO89_01475 [Clostridiales bacterium]|nr:hypothetical protein [Clostridiales bacterium]
MSHEEYFDLFKEAQKRNCPYKAFLIDVVNCREVFKDSKSNFKKFLIFDYITIELLKKNCLRNNDVNKLHLFYKSAKFNNKYHYNFNKEYYFNLDNAYYYNFDNALKQISNIDKLQIYTNEDAKSYCRFNLIINPMIIGDGCCYLTNSNAISDEEFIQIVKNGIKKFDIDYDFHFLSGKYETDSYAEGSKKLYKGYMLQILEHFSKKEGKIISHNELEKLEN